MERFRALPGKNSHQSAAEISKVICHMLAQFRGLAGQDDDLTLVIVNVL